MDGEAPEGVAQSAALVLFLLAAAEGDPESDTPPVHVCSLDSFALVTGTPQPHPPTVTPSAAGVTDRGR